MKMVQVNVGLVVDALLDTQKAADIQRSGLYILLGNALVTLMNGVFAYCGAIQISYVWFLLNGSLAMIASAVALFASQNFLNQARQAINDARIDKDN